MNHKPSTKFIRIAALVGLLLAGAVFAETPLGKRIFTGKKATLQPAGLKDKTLGELIGEDQNKNGIADWEERLYDLDPTITSTNGVSNKDIVLEKRAQVKVAAGQMSKTDTLAQALFATDSLLAGTTLDQDNAANISQQLLKQTLAVPHVDQYTIDDMHIVKTSPASLTKYKSNIAATINTATVDDGMENVANSVSDGGTLDVAAIKNSAKTYQGFTEKLISMNVPTEFAQEHLYFANSMRSVGGVLTILANTDASDKVSLVGAVAAYRSAIIVSQESLAQLQASLVQYDSENQ